MLPVVNLKNFQLAAEKCFVTQSTLSTMIGKFEAEIGIKIFNLYPSKYINFDFQSGSTESLMRITKSRKGLTIIPHLAMTNFSKEDLDQIIEFQSPQPARMVGLVTNKFFVKTKLLSELKK